MIINPTVRNENGIQDVFSQNLDKRVIHLVGEINDEMSATIVAQLLHLEAVDGEKDIHLYINSPGGSVSARLAIYDTMQFIRPKVSTVCLGHAASMAAVILSGGAPGNRMMLKNSEVMIHQPYGGMEGQASELLIAAEHIHTTRQVLTDILAQNCKKTSEEVSKDIERDHWMRANEALEYGIIDHII